MFGAIKKIFRKGRGIAPTPAAAPPSNRAPETTPPPSSPSGAPVSPQPVLPPATNSDSLALPFTVILTQVPSELHGQLAPAGAGNSFFTLTKKRAIEQLSQGTVKINFGELRRAAPAGVFINTSNHDHRLVPLPLNEILRQLEPASFARRTNQRVAEVSADVPDLFGPKGQPLAKVRLLDKSEANSAPAPTAPAAPPARAPKKPQPVTGAKIEGVAAPVAQPTTAKAPSAIRMSHEATKAPVPKPTQPGAAMAPAAQAGSPLAVPLSVLCKAWPEPVRKEIEQLDLAQAMCFLPVADLGEAAKRGKIEYTWEKVFSWLQPKPARGIAESNASTKLELPLSLVVPAYLARAKPTAPQKKVKVSDSVPDVFVKAQGLGALDPSDHATASAAPKAQPKTAASSPSAEDRGVLALSLPLLSQNWPESIRKEIDHLNLNALRLELPLDVVENGLRYGKVDFLWKQICAWLKDCPTAAPSATNAEVRVELPLNVVAPLYLRVRPPPKSPKKPDIAINIPDVFSASGQILAPDSASAETGPAVSTAPPAPVESVAPAAPTAPEPAALPAKKPPEDIAELFGEPDKRNWTPNEIVHKTACLPGVAGAMIALQDGLLVAHCMPPNWKTETIGAFLPQIFGRMNQYSKELKMGEIRSITFTVEGGALLIFNAGIIYFAALGKPGAALPIFELNIIATELSRHTK